MAKQRVIGDDAEDASRQQVEQRQPEAEIAEDEAGRRQCQPDRNAREQQHEERHQHQGGEKLKAHERLLLKAMTE